MASTESSIAKPKVTSAIVAGERVPVITASAALYILENHDEFRKVYDKTLHEWQAGDPHDMREEAMIRALEAVGIPWVAPQ